MIQTANAVYMSRGEYNDMLAARQAVHDGHGDFHAWKQSQGITIRGTKNFYCLGDLSETQRAALGV